MAKISEIMLLQQPEQPALAIEVQTYMKGMSQAIGENFVRIDSLFKKPTLYTQVYIIFFIFA